MTPDSEQELAALLADAREPFAIAGGGTRPIGRPVSGEILSTATMHGISHYEPGALTLVAKAGTPVAEINAVLKKENQRLAFEPMDHRKLLRTSGEPTIGGVVAANVSGPRRIQAGACRDHLLGVRFVDGRGRIIKSGGRVMKNVTGYDLVKLLAGSFGTLGVLSEVSFKVQAIPQAEATILIRDQYVGEAIATLSGALGSPYDVSGVAHAPAGVLGDVPLTAIRVEGMENSVDYRVARLLPSSSSDVLGGEESARFWERIRDVEPFAQRDGAVWRVSLKPSDVPEFTARLRSDGLQHDALFDWGGGLVWLSVPEAVDGGATLVRESLGGFGGHATLVRASEEMRARIPVFQPLPARLAEISEGIRRKFDPHGILNPGLMR